MTRREFLKDVFLVTAAAAGGIITTPTGELGVVLPTINHASTQRILAKYLLGHRIECGGFAKADVIAVPGSNIIKLPDGEFEPDDLEKTRLRAAAKAFHVGMADKIVLLNGQVKAGIDPTTPRRYLQKVYRELTGNNDGIPDEVIFEEFISENTATNAEQLQRIFNQHGWHNALVLTNDRHLDRNAAINL